MLRENTNTNSVSKDFPILLHFILSVTLQEKDYLHPHFTDEKMSNWGLRQLGHMARIKTRQVGLESLFSTNATSCFLKRKQN